MSEQNICIDSCVSGDIRRPGLPKSLTDGFAKLVADFRAWRRKWRTVRAVAHLNDRQLRDIGINRYDLPPAMQDALIANRDQHELLDLYPHSVFGTGQTRHAKTCD